MQIMLNCKSAAGIIVLHIVLSEAIYHGLKKCFYAEEKFPNENISFWLYKNESQTSPVRLNPLKLSSALFKPKLPVKILIHGFFGSRKKSPNTEILEPLLTTQKVYVIAVDYENLVQLPCYYPWAPHNARIVGKCVAKTIDNLIDHIRYNNSEIQIIGFSLGAQVAGLAANYASHRINHITGLDPAHFGFTDADPKSRLDKSDANFIDVIHTDPYFFSSLDALGHADFYVNFPSAIQPGCTFRRNGWFYNCNHFRAPVYYAESITGIEKFWGRYCSSWSNYISQRCETNQTVPNAVMGYFISKSANGSYFLATNARSPFAKGLEE